MTTIKITMIGGKVNYDNYKDNYDWGKVNYDNYKDNYD